MKVRHIYFIKNCPGAPVYELTNGELMLPFATKTGSFVYYTQEECTKGIGDQKKLFKFREIFTAARKEIEAIKEKELAVN